MDVVADLFALVSEYSVGTPLLDGACEIRYEAVELRAGVIGAGETSAAEGNRRHLGVAPVFLDEHVGRELGGPEQAVHGVVDAAGLADAVIVRGIGVLPARVELLERQLVRRVAVDLV